MCAEKDFAHRKKNVCRINHRYNILESRIFLGHSRKNEKASVARTEQKNEVRELRVGCNQ